MVTVTGRAVVDGVPLTKTAVLTVTAPPATTAKKVFGMSAPADEWANRMAEVADPKAINARRIFAQFTADGRNQSDLIEQAVAAGQMPVVTYKGTVTDANLTAVKNYLTSLGVDVAAGYHHEPYGDFNGSTTWPATFRANSLRFAQIVRSPRIKVGPILNGWLLDRKVSDFASFTTPELLALWDFVGMDTYQAESDPSAIPGDRVPLLVNWLTQQGQPNKPILIGEYNAFNTAGIAESGDVFLNSPTVWVVLMWNSGPTGLGTPLTAARLAAFQTTLKDPRVLRRS